ncbi:MAG: HlyC/CorC family transporter [Pseudomonadota bacterium]|nr:HlyC/CorC family transporter [Pseudomonadota bacterium]
MLWSVTIFALLVLVSGVFSAAETAILSANRYRLRHRAQAGDKSARRILKLLKRPDRLLGVILIGNTFANVFAASVGAVIALEIFGDFGVALGGLVISLLILIFAEITPKTLAALHPEQVAYPTSWLLRGLLTIFYPFVVIANGISNALLALFRIKVTGKAIDVLTHDELRTLVAEAVGKSARGYQDMLLGILDLGQVTVEDIMVPRNEIVGIDLNGDWEDVVKQLQRSQHTRLPVYRETIEDAVGMLHARKAMHLLMHQKLTKESLVKAVDEIYFIPEATSLNTLLVNFRQQKCRVGLVVDEYGDIQGLATMEDILEEIVGEYTTDFARTVPELWAQKDGSFLVDGGINIRELNRSLGWALPTEGPKTINGLIVEQLEMIPETNICLRIAGYPIEVVKIEQNAIKQVRIWPDLRIVND